MDVSRYLQEGSLRIYPMGELTSEESPELLMASLAQDIESLPRKYDFIVVDSVTNLVPYNKEAVVIGFFSLCKRLCNEGKTITIAGHSHAFDATLLNCLEGQCDAHLKLGVEQIAGKAWNLLEVRKAQNAALTARNTISFQVVPGIGMRSVPFHKVRV